MTTTYCEITLFMITGITVVHGNRSLFIEEEVEVLDGPYDFTVNHIGEASIDILKPAGFRFLMYNTSGWMDIIEFCGVVNKELIRNGTPDINELFRKDVFSFPMCQNWEYVDRTVQLKKGDKLRFYLQCYGFFGFVYPTEVQTLTVGGTVRPTGKYDITFLEDEEVLGKKGKKVRAIKIQERRPAKRGKHR